MTYLDTSGYPLEDSRELDEAAIIDGANPLQVLRHVIVPLSRPALITVALFSSLFEWNDFLGHCVGSHIKSLDWEEGVKRVGGRGAWLPSGWPSSPASTPRSGTC